MFITSKLWNSEHKPEHVRPACEQCVTTPVPCSILKMHVCTAQVSTFSQLYSSSTVSMFVSIVGTLWRTDIVSDLNVSPSPWLRMHHVTTFTTVPTIHDIQDAL